ncbi:MAG: FtsW/RodA/SpoVE family cell cycle protein [Planctomycetota bacterium]
MSGHWSPTFAPSISAALRRLAIRRTWPILAAAGALTGLGIVCIASVDPTAAAKQVQFLVLAVAALGVFQLIHYRSLLQLAWPIYIAGLLLVAYTVLDKKIDVPWVNPVKGARNWIQLPVIGSLQPAEILKVGFIMVLAGYLRFRDDQRTFRGLLVPGLIGLTPVLLILQQPDLGTALVFIPTLGAMLYVAGARVQHFMLVAAVMGVMLPAIWLSGMDLPVFRNMPALVKDYQRDRVLAMFKSDEQTLMNTGFQQQWALAAIGTGGVLGKGVHDVPAGRRVPEAHNDMIFALVGEQFGLLGAGFVIGCYFVLTTTGLLVAIGSQEPFGRLVAVGIVTQLAAQAVLNMMVALKIMPVTGITLPFVSAGGTSLIASYMAAGILLNVGQYRPHSLARESFEF